MDLSLFDLISNEHRLTRHEVENVLPKLKATRQLIEEIHSSPDPPARPKPCKIKPMRSGRDHTHNTDNLLLGGKTCEGETIDGSDYGM